MSLKPCDKCFSFIITFNSHNNSMSWVLLEFPSIDEKTEALIHDGIDKECQSQDRNSFLSNY